MKPLPAFQADAASQRVPHCAFRDPRQAILFFGHLLEKQELADMPAAANELSRSALADIWRGALTICAHGLGRAIDLVLIWRDRAAARRHLAELDERLLRDIGLNRVDIWRTTGKPF